MVLQMEMHFAGGSWMVKFLPSNIHPRISLVLLHVPSPLANFASEIGSAPQCLVTCGGGKMECIPCNIARDICVRCASDTLLVAPIKSSTYTSISVTEFMGRAEAWHL